MTSLKFETTVSSALQKSNALFNEDLGTLDSDRLHSVKSILYAAIERTNFEAERLLHLKETLRELLIQVAIHPDAYEHESKKGRELIKELMTQFKT